jgi:hypothetical protein
VKGAKDWGNKITAGFIIMFTLLAVLAPSMAIIIPFTEHLVHVLILMMISGLLGLVIGNRIIIFTSFGCAMVLAIFLKNASNTDLRDPIVNQNTAIRIAHINLSSLSNVEGLNSILQQDTSIDVVSFQEYTPDWAAVLPTMMQGYQAKITDVQIDVYGKAIYSKYPFISQSQPSHANIKMINALVNIGKDTFDLASAYIIPALDSMSRSQAREQIKQMQASFVQEDRHRIVMGEFNQVYWTPEIIAFRKQSHLSNSRRDVNIGSAKMPYNHIFYSETLECISFSELTDTENTHVGCVGSYQIKGFKEKTN